MHGKRRPVAILRLCGSTRGVQPCYKTIADFRKDNSGALQVASRDCVQVYRELALIGGVVFHNNPISIFHIISAVVKQIFSRYSNFFTLFRPSATFSLSRAVLDEAKRKEEERWDGLHGVIIKITVMADTEVLARDVELWQIEESFRSAKTDLRSRPICHWTVPRIKAPIAIGFKAFSPIHFLCHRMSGRKDRLSPKRIRDALLARQCTILRDQETDTRDTVSSKNTEEVKAIYKAMGMKLVTATHRVETGKVLSASF